MPELQEPREMPASLVAANGRDSIDGAIGTAQRSRLHGLAANVAGFRLHCGARHKMGEGLRARPRRFLCVC